MKQGHAQTRYETLWKNLDEQYLKKGLTKSALEEVRKIYTLAKKEKQDAQMIKALVYQVNLRENIEENASINRIRETEAAIRDVSEPAASILRSILAEYYWRYFQQNRWKLYNRTDIISTNRDDIATWSIADFHEKISSLYLASLKNEKQLQSATLEKYAPIIREGNVRYLRPALYDLLAFRALDYFRNDERDMTRPAYAFEINDPSYFAPAAEFIKLDITTRDTLSLHHKALHLYQSLLSFHARDARPDAFIDADIHRLEFVNQYGVMEDKNNLYATALRNILEKHPDHPSAGYLLARWHAQRAATYNPLKDTTNRYEYLKAKELCERIVQQKNSSEGKTNSLNLLKEIQQKEILLITEKVNLPELPFRALVSYRNVDRLFLRLVPLTDELKKQLRNRYDDAYWNQLTGLKAIRAWNQSLPETHDHQEHNVEIKVDALSPGAYILLSSAKENFSLDANPMAVQYLYVSSISYVNRGNEYFVMHRSTGQPLAGAGIQAWIQKYNPMTRGIELIRSEKAESDQNGYFRLAKQKQDPQTIQLEVRYKNDRLFLDDNYYTYYRNAEAGDYDAKMNAETFEKNNARVFFFTDRSIYRPGQKIYYKGIAITTDFKTRKAKVLAGRRTQVKLFNANGEESDSVTVTTNEFGSYSGTFTLPENTLNGEFRISDDELNGEINFSVEEYKRPAFYVEYEKIKGTYRVGDSIHLTGSAKAYAGYNIGGAAVKYRVERRPRFIYPWLYGRWGFPHSSPMAITSGYATTGTDGSFSIHFKAIPDLTIDKKLDPVFDYKVIADVTDINGETRSEEIIIPVSYKTLILKINLASGATIPTDSLRAVSISTKNMQDEFEAALVTVTVSPLSAPGRLIRKRYWQQPDQFVMSREDYLRLFPHDEYRDETDYSTWKKGEAVVRITDSTRAGKNFNLKTTDIKPGWYAIEVSTTDKYGSEIKDVQYIQLLNEQAPSLPSVLYSFHSADNPNPEPGEKTSITVGTSASDVFMVREVSHKTSTPANNGNEHTSKYEFIRLSNEKRVFDFYPTENDRGGFGVAHFYVKDNRFYFLSDILRVPWTNKELTITYETFRDKTLPGSDEKWKLKISGHKTEEVASEMLVSMYDASLDQFKPHGWRVPNVWPVYNHEIWTGEHTFTSVQSQAKYNYPPGGEHYYKIYDELDVPQNLQQIRIRGRNSVQQEANLEMAAAAPSAGMDQSLQGRVAGVDIKSNNKLEEVVATGYGAQRKVANDAAQNDAEAGEPQSEKQDIPVQTRKNFNETAFFLPDLKTDAAGNIEFSFTIPEALTRWKFQGMAHTRNAAFGYALKNVITQKQLMVQPNKPRFMREGDRMELGTKIVNLTEKEITGTVQLELLNAETMQPVDGWFKNVLPNQYFSAEAGKSVSVSFSVEIPYQFGSALVCRFIASAPVKSGATGKDAFISDGEESALPVLKNSILVTESQPISMRGTGVKNTRFEKLLSSQTSGTMQQHALTVEFTTNPVWYAVQALPYLMEYPYECSEQVFNRFYANALAAKIANASPKIRAVFEKWRSSSTDSSSLLSNLQKNQELKSVLLEETPWVLEAKSEAQQKKNIALLFDMIRMSKELESNLDKLKLQQLSNGGFVWFKGGPDDRFITQYILTGIGRLKKLNAVPPALNAKLDAIVSPAIEYLDKRILDDYTQLLRLKPDLEKNHLGYLQVQYLYMRSFFTEPGIPGGSFTAVNYYRNQSRKFWLHRQPYLQGMLALSLHRTGDIKTAGDILASLKQNAVVNEESGMYWKENRPGYFWHQAPVETQSLLIEAFNEIGKDAQTMNDLKTWLLKQKQTQHWRTTKATADACYALLVQPAAAIGQPAPVQGWLNAEPVVEIRLGDKIIRSEDQNAEAGSGYFKKVFRGTSVQPSMGNISVKLSAQAASAGPAWGAVYWSYFENLDKITPAATPLQLTKKLFVERSSDRGPVLHPLKDGETIRVGDKIKVRIELRVDRDMEYVHMKDMRASGLEPVNVLSGFKWQGGLGYYESTRDASTNFFFHWLPKGTFVFEYPLFVSHSGNFSNGITSIQCMYAPEFTSHSEGVRITVEK